ncbi:MAG TPA: hypothetical protein PKC39_15455 [Ferruginibacter sp.]|nr:hypothetical protein [Ferruginibacter sp.]HMP22355.1 hypothetical protein [Ferruginibacter sp.]
MYRILTILSTALLTLSYLNGYSQQLLNGTVYDSTKVIPVKDVIIKSSSGNIVMTDSTGQYSISVQQTDSITFIYNYKPTMKFAVKDIKDPANFDIALHIRVSEKFKTLQEVRIYTRSYQQDSIRNREEYAKIFDYKKPGLSLSSDSYTGAAGLDINELVNIFRFKRNRQLRKLQERLIEEEKEKYVNYRFNKALVRRITGLQGDELDIFLKEYRPDFEFTQASSLVDFYQYILNASYQYKAQVHKVGE